MSILKMDNLRGGPTSKLLRCLDNCELICWANVLLYNGDNLFPRAQSIVFFQKIMIAHLY